MTSKNEDIRVKTRNSVMFVSEEPKAKAKVTKKSPLRGKAAPFAIKKVAGFP